MATSSGRASYGARSAARSARHEGGEKVYLLTTSPRESAVFFVLGEKRAAHRRSQRDSQKNGKAASRASVQGMLKRRFAFLIVSRQSFLMADKIISLQLSTCSQMTKEKKNEKEIVGKSLTDIIVARRSRKCTAARKSPFAS